MKRLSACYAEFGLKLYRWVPQVNTVCLREPTIVQCEAGEEALFPNAAELSIVNRIDDSERGRPMNLDVPPTRFVPDPFKPYGLGAVDVVVCPRKREYGSAKNWPHWSALVSLMKAQGVSVFAAGAPDSSYDVPCAKAWDLERFLDASIEVIRSARLVIATDAGLAHLAIMCGAPLLVITAGDLICPGPVLDQHGNELLPRYQKAGWNVKERVNRFQDGNHTGSMIQYVDGWDRPLRVHHEAMGLIR